MTIFDDGLKVLRETLKETAEVKVTYYFKGSRNGLWYVMSATRGNISYGSIAKMGGVPVETDYREYIIRADQFPEGIKPAQRDVIVDGDGMWEAFNNGLQDCWRFSDPNKTLIRIYTRRINDSSRNMG